MAIDKHDINDALNILYLNRYPADAVRRMELLKPGEIAAILRSLPVEGTLKFWERFSPGSAARVLEEMDTEYICDLLGRLEPNLAGNLLKAFSEERRTMLLGSIRNKRVRNDLVHAISYQDDTAGALMDSRVMYFRPDMTVGEVVTILKTRPHGMYRKLYTVDGQNRLLGIVEMHDLAIAGNDEPLSRLQRLNPVYVDAQASREELVAIFETQKMTDLPVVDLEGRLIGVLRYDVLVGAALEESSVDMQTMVGVSKDERALSPAVFATRKRLPWLQINIATAFLAAAVVGLFEETIAQFTALAILLPVVAGQSGNTGAQALAVTLRGLALKEIYPRMWARIIAKEFNVGLLNGIAVAFTTGLGVFIWSQSMGLSLVIMVSMIISMVIASVAGALIPLSLTVAGQDPAQSSSIFLTTVTDVAGFFSFLGIATLFMHML